MARGADRLGYEWATSRNVPCIERPAQWDTLGKQAGFIRNAQMEADELLAFWDGESSGTGHMIRTMRSLKKSVTIINTKLTHRPQKIIKEREDEK